MRILVILSRVLRAPKDCRLVVNFEFVLATMNLLLRGLSALILIALLLDPLTLAHPAFRTDTSTLPANITDLADHEPECNLPPPTHRPQSKLTRAACHAAFEEFTSKHKRPAYVFSKTPDRAEFDTYVVMPQSLIADGCEIFIDATPPFEYTVRTEDLIRGVNGVIGHCVENPGMFGWGEYGGYGEVRSTSWVTSVGVLVTYAGARSEVDGLVVNETASHTFEGLEPF